MWAEFPFKGVMSLCAGCGNQWEILLSSSVNSRQMTEFFDRAGALLYKQPSWRGNAVAPVLLSAEGKASYCRCCRILALIVPSATLIHKWPLEEWESCQTSNISSVFLWADVINKHAIVKSHHWTGGWFINWPVTCHYAVKEKYISIDGKKMYRWWNRMALQNLMVHFHEPWIIKIDSKDSLQCLHKDKTIRVKARSHQERLLQWKL